MIVCIKQLFLIYLIYENKIWIPTDMEKNLSSMIIPAPLTPHPIGNKMVGAITSFNVPPKNWFGIYFIVVFVLRKHVFS
jgi:hypothetical protein